MSKIVIDECERKADEIGVYVAYRTDEQRKEDTKFMTEFIKKLKAEKNNNSNNK